MLDWAKYFEPVTIEVRDTFENFNAWISHLRDGRHVLDVVAVQNFQNENIEYRITSMNEFQVPHHFQSAKIVRRECKVDRGMLRYERFGSQISESIPTTTTITHETTVIYISRRDPYGH